MTSLAQPLTVPAALAVLEQAADEVLPLPALAGPAYARGHALFEARSDQRGLLADWLVQRLCAAARGRASLRVLSVGAGDGRLDAAVVTALLDAEPGLALSWTCVEPLPGSAAACQARLDSTGPSERRRVDVRGCAFEDLAEPGPFDVITFVHSLYYVADVAAALGRAASLLTPGGRLLLAHAPRTGLNELGAVLAPPLQGHPQWWSGTTHDAVRRLPLRGAAGRLTGSLDLRDCFDRAARADVDPDVRQDVLDFVVQAHLPESLRPTVLDVLRALSASGSGADVEHPLDIWDLSLPGVEHPSARRLSEAVA